MKLTLKTLKQEQLDVEVDPSCKISEVKQKISEKYSHDVESQRLIFAGKILDDSQTVESYNITEKEFLVLMVKKIAAKKPAPKPTEPAPAPVPAPVTAIQPESVVPAPNTDVSPVPPVATNDDMVTGDEFEATVARIAEMGFDREQIIVALQASYNNPDRAVEYLMNGIPDNVLQPPAPVQPAASAPVQPAAPVNPDSPAPVQPSAPQVSGNLFQQAEILQQQQSTTEANPVFEQLRQLPNFDAIRQLVQQQPQLLQHVLQNLSQANPQLYQLIVQNQQEFIRLLNEPVPEGTPNINDLVNDEVDPSQPRPGQMEISVTPEEKEAVERLESLGFPRHKVIEAFFACDKDENLAANFLLEHGYDDDPMDDAGAQ